MVWRIDRKLSSEIWEITPEKRQLILMTDLNNGGFMVLNDKVQAVINHLTMQEKDLHSLTIEFNKKQQPSYLIYESHHRNEQNPPKFGSQTVHYEHDRPTYVKTIKRVIIR